MPVEFDAVWDIDFALDPSMATGVRGTVTDSATGEPIAGAYIDAWRVDTGSYLTSFVTGSDGTFFDEVYAMTYTFSTDTNGRYEEEIYDDIPCPEARPTRVTAIRPPGITSRLSMVRSSTISTSYSISGL